MNINRQNYEVIFIDYFDGKLTAEQVAELMFFITLNPDLKEEFNSFEEITLPVSTIEFKDKNQLKNLSQNTFNITNDTFDTYCVAYLEGDLTTSEKTKFEIYLLKNPDKYKEYTKFAKTKLIPENEITFKNKISLKRFEISKNYKRIIITNLTGAASVAVLILLYFLSAKSTDIKPRYAVRDTIHSTIISDSVPEKILNIQPVKQKNQNQIATVYKKENIRKENKILNVNSIKSNKDTSSQSIQNSIAIHKTDTIEYLENKKITALAIEPMIQNNILINYAQYKKIRKNEEQKTLAQFVKTKLQKAIRGKNTDPDHKFGYADVADALIRGINKITGKKMKLQKTYDSKGEVETLAFYSDNFQVYKGSKK